jgi:hypothetical protein
MSGFDDSIRGDLDRWITTAPDCYTKTLFACAACGYYFEEADMEWVAFDESAKGVCLGCWEKGERPDGWDGDE